MKPNLTDALTESLALMGNGGNVTTPAGLHISQSALDGMVKAESKRSIKEANKSTGQPQFFSEYSLAQNMVAYGAREKPHGTPSFNDLQFAARRSFVDAILIRARADQMKMVWQPNMLGKQIGFKVVHDRHADPDFKEDDATKERCIEITKLINNPTPEEYTHLYPNEVRTHHNIKDFMSRMIRAELVIDRKCMYRYKRRNGKGFAAFHWVPGETIRPVHEAIKKWATQNDIKDLGSMSPMHFGRVVDKMSHATGFNIHDSDYVQLIDGRIVAAFTKEELSVHIANPSDELNRQGYGESRLEISLDITASLVYAWQYNQELFKTNYPENILMVSGAYDKAGLQAFKQQLLAEGGQIENNWRLPIISTASDAESEALKMEAIKIRDTPKDMLFDQFFRMMVALKCFKYDTMVDTDRGKMRIGEVASKRLPVKIKSFDRNTGKIVWADVTDWQALKEKLWVKLFYPGGKKRRTIEVTHDHELWAGDRMVEARDLNIGDTLYVEGEKFSGEQEQVLLGSILGDGYLRKSRGFCDVPNFTESHSESQRDYIEWKARALGNLDPKLRDHFVKAKAEGKQKYASIQLTTKATAALYSYRKLCYDDDGIKTVSWEWLNRLDVLGLAIWFMDDGNFTKRTGRKNVRARIALMPSDAEECSLYLKYFIHKWGLYPKISPKKNTRGMTLDFSVQDSKKLIDILSDHLEVGEPLSKFSGPRKVWVGSDISVCNEEGLVPVPIIGKENLYFDKGRPCYDVTVSGTHTLFANGLASSNCAAYGAHPTIINFSVDSGGQGGLFGRNPSDEIEFSKEHGFKPALMDMAEWLTESIVKPNHDDLRLIIVGIDEEDESAALELLTKKGASFITRNEMRTVENLEPIGDVNDPDNPWNMPNDAPIATYLDSLANKAQAEAMAAGGGDEFGADEYDNQDMPEFDDGQDEQSGPAAPEPEAVEKSQKRFTIELEV